MKLVCKHIVVLMLVGVWMAAGAQEVAEVRFDEFLERLPQPQATLGATRELYGTVERIEKETGYYSREINTTLDVIYQSWHARMVEAVDRAKTDKAFVAGLNAEERKLVENMTFAISPMPRDATFHTFKYVIQFRPSVSKLTWGRMNQPLSARGQALYQQLLQVEKQTRWLAFAEEVSQRRLKFNDTDERLTKLNKQFNDALAALPKRKVAIAEGVTDEMEDPAKAVKVHEQHLVNMQQFYDTRHRELYTWWQENMQRISGLCQQLDAICQETQYGQALNGSDQQLRPVLADVQARLWWSLELLNEVSLRMMMDAVLTDYHQQQTVQAIKAYREFEGQVVE